MPKNPELELALQFIDKTDRNIFVTGKAGTGKTTFLHQIKKESLKRMVIIQHLFGYNLNKLLQKIIRKLN